VNYLDLEHGPVDLGGRDVLLVPEAQGVVAGVHGLHTLTPEEDRPSLVSLSTRRRTS